MKAQINQSVRLLVMLVLLIVFSASFDAEAGMPATWISGADTVDPIGNYGVYGTKGVPDINNIPGTRHGSVSWTDSGGILWLFGGYGNGISDTGYLNDLWKYDGTYWTWVGGSTSVWSFGVYGVKGVPDAANVPGRRAGSISWIDSGDNLWLFAGLGADNGTYGQGRLNDLWRFDGTDWTWISGSELADGSAGVYGTQGVADAANVPGGRVDSISWIDSNGVFWLFGGDGYDSAASEGKLNDLWKFDGSNWTWVSGANTVDNSGVYGTQGVANPANLPGARHNGVSWVDTSGNLWLFGGEGYDSAGSFGKLNDLWKFDGSNWTWVSGAQTVNNSGVYGTIGAASGSNVPGARAASVSWIDSGNILWLFGGEGYDSAGSFGRLNDLWKFDGADWTWVSGAQTVNNSGVYGTQGVSDPGNIPGSRYNGVSWLDPSGALLLFGGVGYDSVGSNVLLNDLWKFTPELSLFTYQGRLLDNNTAADGLYDIQFKLYDHPDILIGNQVGLPINFEDLSVTDGYFVADLDFGSGVFKGEGRWLEISVRPFDSTDPNAYIALEPLQPIRSAPYAVYADQSDWNNIFSMPADFADGVDDIGLTAESDPTVAASVKDGVSWAEVAGRPAGLDDGDDDTQLTEAQVDAYVTNNGYLLTESDPQVGSNTTNYVPRWNGSALATGSIFDNGDVGIGTSSPSEKLEVSGAVKATRTGADGPLLILNDSNGSNDRPGIQFTNNSIHYIAGDDAGNETFGFYSQYGNNRANDAVVKIHGDTGGGSNWNNYLSLTHDGTDGVISTDAGDIILSPAQQVGIGTIDTGGKLSVYTNSDEYALNVKNDKTSGNNRAISGTALGNTTGYSFGVIGTSVSSSGPNFGVQGNVSGTAPGPNYGVQGNVTAASSGANYGVYGSASSNSSGPNFGVYGTAGNSGTGSAHAGYFVGNVHVIGNITYTGTIGDVSDIRLKENIAPLGNGIEKISCLKGIYYNNKGESPDNREVGVIAQDVEKVLPELVLTNKEGYKSVDYTKLTPVLIEAVKELKAENDELKERLATLEDAINKSNIGDRQ